MPKRLERLPQGLLEGYLRGLLDVLKDKVDPDRLEAEFLRELEQFDAAGILQPLTIEPGILRSADLNENYNRVFLGLSSLYKGYLVSDKKQQDQAVAMDNMNFRGEQSVLRILQDLKAHRLLKLNPDYNDIKLIQFNDSRNGAVGGTKLSIDPNLRGLTLAEIDRSRFHDRRGLLEPEATVTVLTEGVTEVSRKTNSSELIIDNDPQTFWSESVYSEEPLLSTYASTTYGGLVVQVEVDFRQTELVNRLDLKPFGVYPVRLLNLEVSTDGSSFTQVSNFTEPSSDLFWWSFFFTPTPTRYVRATLLQESYTEHVFQVPESILRNQMVFDQLVDTALRFAVGSREDSEVDIRESTVNESVNLALDAIGQLDNRLGIVRQPGDSGTAGRGLTFSVAELLKLAGVEDRALGLQALSPEQKVEKLVTTRKLEYTLGLFHLEVSRSTYHPIGEYSSPLFTSDGTVWEVALNASPSHNSIIDASSFSFPATTAEFEIEIAPFRKVPILPQDTSVVYEVVSINPRTRSGQVRFSTTDGTPLVWKNGGALDIGQGFTFTPATGTLTISNDEFSVASIYLIRYIPSSGQDLVDVETLYNSFELPKPDVFKGTDGENKILLTFSPYVDYDKINNKDLFRKDSAESRFHFRSDIGQSIIDGVGWGIGATTLSSSIGDSDTSIPVADTSDFTDSGTLIIGSEELQYTSKTATTFEGITRGASGTQATSHDSGNAIISSGSMIYDPILVTVDGVRAINRTDYYKGEHPALLASSSGTLQFSYIQVGNRVYFNGPVPQDRNIEVKYNVLTQYLKLNTTFRQTVAGQRLHTPTLTEATLFLNRAEI